MKKTVANNLIFTFYLTSILSGCGVDSSNLLSPAGSGDRFLCADDVTFRDDNLDPLDSIHVQRGSKVVLLSEPKKAKGDIEGHWFVKVQISGGKKVWVSSSYLKIAECSANNFKNSVLHFQDEAPGILAMLDTIAFAEFRNHPEATAASAYQTIFDYRKFTSFKRHPEILICAGICSDAAGRYQFMSTTWNDSNRYLSNHKIKEIPWLNGPLTDFSPKSQDKMAIFKIWWRYAYDDLKNILPGDNKTLYEATQRLSQEWASLPGSTYGQGELNWETFKKYYWSRYSNYH